MHRLATLALAVVVLGQMSYPPAPGPRPPLVVVFPAAPQPIVVQQVAAPDPPAPVPHALPAPAPDPDQLGPCPAPYRRGTDVPVAALPDGIDIDDVLVSDHDVRLMAAWSADVMLLSTDEGRSWTQVLDGEYGVGAAAFDCHGRLHVVRGDGMLGTYDDGADEQEIWEKAASLDDSESGYAALIPDGTGVALVGVDGADDERLILARRDARGRWRTKHLYKDEYYGSWDGIQIGDVRALDRNRSRFSVMAMPWSGGECGYGEYREVTFDLALAHVNVDDLGPELPPSRQPKEPPELDDVSDLHRDRAGRWYGIDYSGEHRTVIRLTAAQVRERQEEDEAGED